MKVREPAVAGAFYPADPTQLRTVLGECLDGARFDTSAHRPPPKAMIVPHAGYIYSGPVAASAYARLTGARSTIRRVVLAGPAHWVAFDGLAAIDVDGFATPLGTVPVDRGAVATALGLPGVGLLEAAHRREHCLEVQLPFLQALLGDFAVVPLLAGRGTAAVLAQVLEALWDGPETLMIVTTDLTHGLDHASARGVDQETARAIGAFRAEDIGPHQACGWVCVRAILEVARQRGLRSSVLDLRSSGDIAGPRDRVVGYGAFVFEEGVRDRHIETTANGQTS